MADTCCIHSRAIAVALVVNSIVTLAAIGALVATNVKSDPSCPPEVNQPLLVEPVLVDPTPPQTQWASLVRDFSTEYSTSSWSAQQALGAPDVYPRSGDIAGAWASREPDAKSEFIELGFARPMRMRALEIYETFNPGAIASVELITEQGTRIEPRQEFARTGGAARSTFGTGCTADRIVAVRITVASGKVAGWNEIDAVGMLPCQ